MQGGPAVTLLSVPPIITDPASKTLSSATIKIANAGGSAVAGDELYINGQQSGIVDGGFVAVSWNNANKTLNLVGNISIAAYETLLSEITYQDAGTDSSIGGHPQRTVTWTVNDGTYNLSTTSQVAIERAPVATVANVVLNANFTTVAASSLLTSSDPDGDAITKYEFMDTGNGHFVLNGVAQGNNQEIDVTVAQLSQLTYQTAGGTDSLQVRVNDGTLWSTWQSFTVTGPAATVIEAFGSTSLVEVGSNFYLDSISSGSGPKLKYAGAAFVAGQIGAWAPIGAEQTATGFEVAWKVTGADQYSVWNTDSSGNYTSNAIGVVSGTSNALESFETSFHHGDGVNGVPPSPTSATLATAGASSDSVTFTGSPSILTLETPSALSGHIVGFTGDGTLAGSDQIDLPGMNYSTLHSSYASSTGVLDLNDGTSTADLQFVGNYSQDSFKFAGDGSGGLVVYALTAGQPIPAGAGAGAAATQVAAISPVNVSVAAGQDTFVFAPNFAQVTIANFKPATDTIQISHSVFANVSSLLAATHDDAHGNSVISDAAHDTITIQNVTTAQLLAHQSDFHFV